MPGLALSVRVANDGGSIKSSLLLLVAALSALAAAPAMSEIIYTYVTTANAPSIGPVAGQFSVPNQAIRDGFISATEITSFNFSVSAATTPFLAATFSPPDSLTIFSPLSGRIPVNPQTGAFVADAVVAILDGTTGQTLGITAIGATHSLQTGGGQFVQGAGQWIIQQTADAAAGTPLGVPAIGPWGLAILGAMLGLLAALRVATPAGRRRLPAPTPTSI